MRRILIIIFLFISTQVFPWGKTGHRVVGEIAQRHLTKKALKNIQLIMGTESLAMSANWMDFIRSESAWKHADPWHYCTIPGEMTYKEAGTPDEGDIIVTLNRLISDLETKQFSDGNERIELRFLVHLVGDIHQPLHVGNGEDRGGNGVKVKWFWQSRNLHSVWDSGIIDDQQLSYSEWVSAIDHATPAQVEKWQQASVLDWAYESRDARAQVYDLPEDLSINYKYAHDNIELVQLRLLQAGIRLAGVLNRIYG